MLMCWRLELLAVVQTLLVFKTNFRAVGLNHGKLGATKRATGIGLLEISQKLVVETEVINSFQTANSIKVDSSKLYITKVETTKL